MATELGWAIMVIGIVVVIAIIVIIRQLQQTRPNWECVTAAATALTGVKSLAPVGDLPDSWPREIYMYLVVELAKI